MKNRVITISREFGSGGRTIGKKVAEKLGIPCYDSELIQELEKQTGFAADYVKEAGEYAPGGFLRSRAECAILVQKADTGGKTMSKVYSWRKLNEKELTRVYLDEMRRDFPPTELKPLSMILNSEADGTAHTWGVFDGETLAAYLLMVRPAGSRVSQLDYFAVLPEYRSAGLGAQLLADLPQHERGAQAILIEAECPDKAEDEAMAVRRLGFYSRCGARDTGFTEHLFDAWFRILVLDCPGAGTFADRQAVDALVDCYRRTISETEWQKYVQFYCPDGTKYC